MNEPAGRDVVRHAHERVREAEGRRARHALGPIDAVSAARFAVACDTPAELLDDDGLPGGHIPALYLSSIMGWGAGLHEAMLRSDGTGGDVLADLPLEGLHLMGVGQELEFGPPVKPGTEVVMEISVDSVELKHGRSGSLLLITVLRRFLDAKSGNELVVCRERFIGR
jgi:hypothetical protein